MLSLSCRTSGRSQHFVVVVANLISEMPKYAVAAGINPGIYDTWAECKSQVEGFKGAKYRKFDTQEQAQAFIDECKGTRKRTAQQMEVSECDAPYFRAENIHRPDLISLNKVSLPSTKDHSMTSLTSRLSALESKLTAFMDTTTKLLGDLASRVSKLEKGEVGAKRIKVEPTEILPTDGYHFNSKGFVCVYTDGACSKNGQQGARAGIGVWFNHNHPLNLSAPVKGPPTNNTAEIQAARVAISQAASAGLKNLSIHTDSQFVINCITKWIHRWKKNGWKLTSGGEVKNKTELIKLEEAIQTVDVVEWVYVRGHQGTLGNEMADRLARDGAAMYDSNVRFADHVDGEDEDEIDDVEESS